jgi:DNA repair protein RadC
LPERLYQLRFDETFKPTHFALDVTPKGLARLRFPGQEPEPAQLARIDTTSELGRFVREVTDRISITSPAEAARIFSEQVFSPFETVWQEELWTMLLNTKNHCTHLSMVYRGNVNSSIIRAAEVYRNAIVLNSTALIMAHNHPSGDPSPSPEDIQVTQYVGEFEALIEAAQADVR